MEDSNVSVSFKNACHVKVISEMQVVTKMLEHDEGKEEECRLYMESNQYLKNPTRALRCTC